jgi:uncharacterized coiled-coil DUF342 family protein
MASSMVQLWAQLGSAMDAAAQAEKEAQEATEEAVEANTSADTARTAVDTLTSELRSTQADLEKLRAELATATAATTTVDEVSSAMADLKMQLETAQAAATEADTLKQQMSDLQRQLNHTQAHSDALEADVSRLTTELAAANAESVSHQASVESLTKEVFLASHNMTSSAAERDAAVTAKEEAEATIAKLQTEVARLQLSYASTAAAATLSPFKSPVMSRVLDTAELEAMRHKVQALTQERDGLKAVLAALKEEVVHAKDVGSCPSPRTLRRIPASVLTGAVDVSNESPEITSVVLQSGKCFQALFNAFSIDGAGGEMSPDGLLGLAKACGLTAWASEDSLLAVVTTVLEKEGDDELDSLDFIEVLCRTAVLYAPGKYDFNSTVDVKSNPDYCKAFRVLLKRLDSHWPVGVAHPGLLSDKVPSCTRRHSSSSSVSRSPVPIPASP